MNGGRKTFIFLQIFVGSVRHRGLISTQLSHGMKPETEALDERRGSFYVKIAGGKRLDIRPSSCVLTGGSMGQHPPGFIGRVVETQRFGDEKGTRTRLDFRPVKISYAYI